MEQVVEQPLVESPIVIEPDAPEQPESTSVADHAKQFGPQADKSEPEAAGQALKPIRPVDQQRRDQGKFAEGKQRLKAKDAVERINQLTGRAKTAEEKLAAAEAELATLRTQRAAPATIAKAEQRVERAEAKVEGASAGKASTFSEAEPDEADPKFGGDYGKYLRALAGWEGRKAYHDEKHADAQRAEEAKRVESERQVARQWSERVAAAKTKYADFESVAFGPTLIAPDSLVDRWIMEHKSGADVLYYLQSHRQELESLLAKPVLEQVEDLALLSQRLLSPQRQQAGTTGSAAAPQSIVLPPRPPNPVRTEAPRASDGPPPLDGSLSIAEHAKHFGKARR
jgi:hypothetical protein